MMTNTVLMVVTLSLISVHLVTAATTTFGKYFVVTVPIMDHSPWYRLHEITFELCTRQQTRSPVNVHGHNWGPTVSISRDSPSTLREKLETNLMSSLEANIKHYRFDSEIDFGVTAFVFSRNSSASFAVIPVKGWGMRYYAFTLRQNPSIQIVSHDTVRLLITFVFEDLSARYYYRGLPYRHGMTIELTIEKWDVFPLQNCTAAVTASYNSWTGTLLIGDTKFGVISGSCNTNTDTYYCNSKYQVSGFTTGDAALEMLLPHETYGLKFIIPELSGRRNMAFYFMTSGDQEILVKIHEGDKPYTLGFRSAGHTLKRRYVGPAYIVSTKGIQLMFAWHSQCYIRTQDKELGDVAITTIIPVQLYFYAYTWRIPGQESLKMKDIHYVTVMARIFVEAHVVMQIDGEHRLDYNASIPFLHDWQLSNYLVVTAKSSGKSNNVYSNLKRPFGCYIYGIDYGEGFLHAAGYISSPINIKCSRTMVSMTAGDLIDNDCDRRIDEEVENSKDDDNDTLIDEDLGYLTDYEKKILREESEKKDQVTGIVNGGWSDWADWMCTANCPSNVMVRKRLCNRPTPANGGKDCTGRNDESKKGDCYKNKICPEGKEGRLYLYMHSRYCGQISSIRNLDCSDYFWDLDCIASCEMCQSPCNKFTGVCDYCKKGFKSPNTGCNIPCGFNEYGVNCRGNCTEKCGSDCFERLNGKCPVHGAWSNWYAWKCTPNCKDTRQSRKRSCNKPKPSRGGNPCLGDKIQYREHICYQNTQCQQDCPAFRWEINCTESCENCMDDCNKFNGSCKRCRSGFKFPETACLTVCSANEYGENCEGDCSIKCGEDCFDRIVGTCSVHGGWSDWEEWHCTSSCRESREMRIRNCNRPRPEQGGRNCIGDETEMRAGTCYQGVTCSEDCPMFTWDLNCVQLCANCIDDCNKKNGSCLSCKKGYKSAATGCSKDCDGFEYGENCQGDCRIKCGEDCSERKNGDCPVHGHWGVWSDWTCAECPDSRMVRLRNCDNPAPSKGGKSCDGLSQESKNWTCYADMMYCYEDCPPKTWALNCSKSCINCVDDCNKYHGFCTSCQPGFKQPNSSCSRSCEENEFGEDCLGNCTEKCGEDCENRVLGTCRVYGSWLTWQEWQCTRNCKDTSKIRYRGCKSIEDGVSRSCRSTNFEMLPSDCYVGNVICPTDCPEFHWGTTCKGCQNCKYDCDRFNGSCHRCLPGYQHPETGCLSECDPYYYGKDCLEDCQRKCGEDCINRETGECPASKMFLWSLFLLLLIPLVIYCFKSKNNVKMAQSLTVASETGLE
ncbi:hypothetical protein Btru_009793 [Bulinus truncatus]|nr:hypothetical protein Btru_009793 [Bulinus truncatus]